MSTTIEISPLTRIEGHLAIHTKATPLAGPKGQKVYRITEANCEGEMFRGFEVILRGRDPLDAQQITQRICGVCPISHGIASILAQEEAYGIRPTHNGRLLQNLILAANYMQSHIVHFYHLAALDFVDIKAILNYTGSDRTLRNLRHWAQSALRRGDVFAGAPFLPRYEVPQYVKSDKVNWSLIRHYTDALKIRAIAHEACAVFGAKVPHSTALVPGGCTQVPTMERVLAYRSRLQKIRAFIEDVYIPDLLAVARTFPDSLDTAPGCGNFLCFGVFDTDNRGGKFIPPGVVIQGKWEPFDPRHITEHVRYSRFDSESELHPSEGATHPAASKRDAYSWLKAPRYKGYPMEVGPLARILVNFLAPGNNWIKDRLGSALKAHGIPPEKAASLGGRHYIRCLETLWIAEQAERWLDEVEIGGAPAADFEIPETGAGVGLTEAPRGALGHWISIKGHKIENYQCVVPTTWNASPRDDRGTPGPIETALEGILVEDPKQPLEAARVVRGFDPCLACAIH